MYLCPCTYHSAPHSQPPAGHLQPSLLRSGDEPRRGVCGAVMDGSCCGRESCCLACRAGMRIATNRPNSPDRARHGE